MDDTVQVKYYLFGSGESVTLYESPDIVTQYCYLSPDDKWLWLALGWRTQSTRRILSPLSLSLLSVEGGEPRKITDTLPSGSIRPDHHGWSADSKEVVISARRRIRETAPDGSEIRTSRNVLWRLPISGGNPVILDLDIDNLFFFSYDSNNQFIAYSTLKQPITHELWVLENFLPSTNTIRRQPE